ncbi:MAG: NUDIX domain-containing protein [Bacteroidales bacterium]
MYSIFFNNRRLQFCRHNAPLCAQPGAEVITLDRFTSWEDLIVSFQCHSNWRHLLVPVENPGDSFVQLCNSFQVVPAAGGLVTNPQGDLLMIYRYGKWDLPKGKQEDGESLKETALREVAEETGTKPLQLINDTCNKTYHCYHYMGENVLKMTAWYRMTGCSSLMPQTEEGIEKVEWVPRHRLEERLNCCFASIALLIRRTLLDTKEASSAKIIE